MGQTKQSNLKRAVLMAWVSLLALGCQVSVTTSEVPSNNPVSSVIRSSPGEAASNAKEWVITESGARVGVTKSVLSESVIVASGAKVQIEVGHE